MSERDIAALGIMSRRQIQQAKLVEAMPKEEFEAFVLEGALNAYEQSSLKLWEMSER